MTTKSLIPEEFGFAKSMSDLASMIEYIKMPPSEDHQNILCVAEVSIILADWTRESLLERDRFIYTTALTMVTETAIRKAEEFIEKEGISSIGIPIDIYSNLMVQTLTVICGILEENKEQPYREISIDMLFGIIKDDDGMVSLSVGTKLIDSKKGEVDESGEQPS